MLNVANTHSTVTGVFGLQSKRISAKDALAHPYLDEGRLRYHTCMCKCCYTTSTGRVYTSDFEPVTNPKFDDDFEKNLSSVRQVKGKFTCCYSLTGVVMKDMTIYNFIWITLSKTCCRCFILSEIIHQFILEQQKGSRVPLCINPQSAAFKSFIRWEALTHSRGTEERERERERERESVCVFKQKIHNVI